MTIAKLYNKTNVNTVITETILQLLGVRLCIFGFLCLLASQTVSIFAHAQTCIIVFFQKYLKRWITEILHCKMLK